MDSLQGAEMNCKRLINKNKTSIRPILSVLNLPSGLLGARACHSCHEAKVGYHWRVPSSSQGWHTETNKLTLTPTGNLKPLMNLSHVSLDCEKQRRFIIKVGIYRSMLEESYWWIRNFTKAFNHFIPLHSWFALGWERVKTDPESWYWSLLCLLVPSSDGATSAHYSGHSSNLRRITERADSCIRRTLSLHTVQLLLTNFHLQGWGLVVDGDGFPLSGVGVRLWGRRRGRILGTTERWADVCIADE